MRLLPNKLQSPSLMLLIPKLRGQHPPLISPPRHDMLPMLRRPLELPARTTLFDMDTCDNQATSKKNRIDSCFLELGLMPAPILLIRLGQAGLSLPNSPTVSLAVLPALSAVQRPTNTFGLSCRSFLPSRHPRAHCNPYTYSPIYLHFYLVL
jgi:hypothetical protein